MTYFSRSDVSASNREARRSAATVKRSSRSDVVASDASEALGDDLVLDGFEEGDGSGGVAIAGIVQHPVVEGDRDRRLHCPSSFRNGFTSLPPDSAGFPRNCRMRG